MKNTGFNSHNQLAALLTLVIAVVGMTCARISLAQIPKENLLQNGGFEQGARAWKLHPNMLLVRESDQPGAIRLLSRSLPAPDDGYIHEDHTSQCINFGDARKFFIDAEFFYLEYPSENHAHRLNYTWFDNKGCTGGGQYGGFLEPALQEGWQTLLQDNIQSALNSQSLLINLTHNRRASARKLNLLQETYYWVKGLFTDSTDLLSSGYWDNISLVATSYSDSATNKSPHETQSTLAIGVNLLTNSDFNRDAEHWYLGSDTRWTADEGSERVGSLRVVRQSLEGSRGSFAFDQCVDVGEHTDFALGGYFRRDPASTQTGNGRLRAVWFEFPGCKGQHRISQQDVDSQRIDGWQHLHIAHLPASTNARSVKFQGIQAIDGVGDFIGYWDDLYLIAK